ncbi:MAG: ABC transporter ATP-binding protein [Lachnospiraceae bacterium]|nr:ABC transporter ATP-binding protein [Lachnospiraceae bacterium]
MDGNSFILLAGSLGVVDILDSISWICTAIGSFMLFKKDGIRRIYAFIPGLREYQLSKMAEREEDGRTYLILNICYYLAKMLEDLFEEGSLVSRFWIVVELSLAIAIIPISIRIFASLCRVFKKPKKWVAVWIILQPVASIIWGFGKDYQPDHELTDIDYSAAAAVSNTTVEELRHGLTVNINERTLTSLGRKIYLLRDIHLSIPTGHMVLLLGGSGAGKTTFLNAVTGYEKADAEIIIDGKNLYNNYESMKYSLGFVPQQDLMRQSDTVIMTLKDAASVRLPKSMTREEKKKRINEVLDKFGLQSVASSQVVKLSGGQRKRLSIALELISDPTLFILDEPDSGLDGVVARNLFTSLRGIADEGKIVVVITHTPDRVIDMFDDVIVLAKDASRTGRLAYYGPVKEAYEFFGKTSMEDILLSVNQTDEGGEGRADEFVEKYAELISRNRTESEAGADNREV